MHLGAGEQVVELHEPRLGVQQLRRVARLSTQRLPKARLIRVSSRLVWGLLVRGSSPVWHTRSR